MSSKVSRQFKVSTSVATLNTALVDAISGCKVSHTSSSFIS